MSRIKKIKKQIKSSILKYILAGFGIVAALAWNDAIKSLINALFPLERDSVIIKFIYALAMTMVLVIMSIYLTKFLKNKD